MGGEDKLGNLMIWGNMRSIAIPAGLLAAVLFLVGLTVPAHSASGFSLIASSNDVVSGTSAIFTPSGSATTFDYSDLKYEVRTASGRSVKLQVDYKVESTATCRGETYSSTSSLNYCRVTVDSSVLKLEVPQTQSAGLSSGAITLEVLENKPAVFEIRAWLDVDGNDFRDLYEPYSTIQTLRNYAPGELPALLEHSFNPPVWGERFSASVGARRMQDRFIYTSSILNESQLQLEVQQGEESPFVVRNSLMAQGSFVSQYLAEDQLWYFENVGTEFVKPGATTNLDIGLFVRNGSPWTSNADGTYITAQLQSYNADTGNYGSVPGAPYTQLETDSSGVVDVTITSSENLTGVGRLEMRYFSFDDTQIAISYIPITFVDSGSLRDGSGWKRQVFSSGVAKSHVGIYVMRLFYEANGERFLIGERTFDYTGFSVSKVIANVSSVGQVLAKPAVSNLSEQIYTLSQSQDSFTYSVKVLNDSGQPKPNAPVFIELGLQDYDGAVIELDGASLAADDGLVIERQTDGFGMVELEVGFPSSFDPDSENQIQLIPQVFGMRGSTLPGVERDRTVIRWQGSTELYLDLADLTITDDAASLDFLVTNQSRAGVSHPLLITAGNPLQLNYSSLTSSSSGTFSATLRIAPGSYGVGVSTLAATILTDGELKQLQWQVAWDAQQRKLEFTQTKASAEQPVLRITNQVDTRSYQLEVFEQSLNNYQSTIQVRDLDGAVPSSDVNLAMTWSGLKITDPLDQMTTAGDFAVSFASTNLAKATLVFSSENEGSTEDVLTFAGMQKVATEFGSISLSHPSAVSNGGEVDLGIDIEGLDLEISQIKLTATSGTVGTINPDGDAYMAALKPANNSTDSLQLKLAIDVNQDGDFLDEVDQEYFASIPVLYRSIDLEGRALNAGSFKGYVAIYAKGYQGQRLTAKVGNDWIVVPAIPAAPNDLYRHIEFVGAGVSISVAIYIDRVLLKTVPLKTK